jgi:Winged helix DNA-binding domain
MPARVLSTRALNRALLARQLLLERADHPVTTALERIAGLQTQYAPSGYIGLWSRLHNFQRPALTQALEQRRVIQATLMRVTIHMVSARDYHLFSAGVRAARQTWWRAMSRTHGLSDISLDDVAASIRSALAHGPRRRAQLVAALEEAGFDKALWNAVGLWVDMIRVPPSGTWERRRADLYGLADQWTTPVDITEADGMEHLVKRYLSGFGPATLADIASWTGINVTTLRPVIERLRLRRFRDDEGRELLDVLQGLLPDPDTPAPVRFLPTWDATLLVHARRTQILPEQYRGLVFSSRNPHSTPTFLVDGSVAGAWRYERDQIELKPYGKLRAADRHALEHEAERLAAFHAD